MLTHHVVLYWKLSIAFKHTENMVYRSNAREEVTVRVPPVKRGKRPNNTSVRGPADVGSGDRQTDLLTRDDQCSYHVQAVWDSPALPWRNYSNAVAPASGTPVTQALILARTSQPRQINTRKTVSY